MIWRASHNAIPTLCNLWKRKAVNSIQCSRCLTGSEDTVHALWSCPALYVIWQGNKVLTKLLRYEFDTFSDLLGMVFLLKERVDTNLLAIIFWLIWSKRNSDRCRDKFVKITHIRGRANTLLQDFLAAQNPQYQPNTESVRAVRWIPPILPHYKVNFDGACFTTEGAAGLGAMICDASDKVFRALAQRIKNFISAATMEALTCRRAMFLAKDEGVLDCIFEGDA